MLKVKHIIITDTTNATKGLLSLNNVKKENGKYLPYFTGIADGI